MEDQIYQVAISLLQYKSHLLFWLLPAAIGWAVCAALFYVWVQDRIMRCERWAFGSWINEASADSKAHYYSFVIGGTLFGSLICTGLVVGGLLSH